jgi:hypothetical protein
MRSALPSCFRLYFDSQFGAQSPKIFAVWQKFTVNQKVIDLNEAS